MFPNSIRLNRGNTVMKDLVQTCLSQGVTDLVLVHEHRGVPDALIISHLPHGPTLSMTLHNVTLRHDVSTSDSTVSEQYPHLIMEGFTTRLGERVASILKALFPVPKEDAKRVMTFANERDFISFRYAEEESVKLTTGITSSQRHLTRMCSSRRSARVSRQSVSHEKSQTNSAAYEIRQGTVDQNEADVEWLLRPYMRTSKKRNQL